MRRDWQRDEHTTTVEFGGSDADEAGHVDRSPLVPVSAVVLPRNGIGLRPAGALVGACKLWCAAPSSKLYMLLVLTERQPCPLGPLQDFPHLAPCPPTLTFGPLGACSGSLRV